MKESLLKNKKLKTFSINLVHEKNKYSLYDNLFQNENQLIYKLLLLSEKNQNFFEFSKNIYFNKKTPKIVSINYFKCFIDHVDFQFSFFFSFFDFNFIFNFDNHKLRKFDNL
jgi:hypothetical protein